MNSDEKIDVLYNLQIKENDQIIDNLEETINKKINNSLEANYFSEIKICDSITKVYLGYLESIEKEINLNGNKIFFENDGYTKKGKEYISNSEKYLREIEDIKPSKYILHRIKILIDTKDLTNEENHFIKYLDYYFRGYPVSHSTAFVNEKRKALLIFENEMIDEIIINNKN